MIVETATTSPNQNARPAGVRPSSITIHHWGASGQSFDAVVRYLCRPGGTSSAHYVAQDGRVACIVDPDRRAWHAGTSRGNDVSIGIECRPEATDGDYATVAQLVADLRAAYGPIPLVPHSAWKATACPGRWDLGRLEREAKTWQRTGKPAPIVTPAAPPTPPSTGKAWPEGLVPVTDAHTTASHTAYVAMLAGVGFKQKPLTRAVQHWLRWNGYYSADAGFIIDGKWGRLTTQELQKFLRDRGHYAGTVDGDRGPLTIRAEIAYINSQARYFRKG